MKLILCTKCGDVFKVPMPNKGVKRCSCGLSSGCYEQDGWHAWFSGAPAVPLGILNTSLRKAIISQKLSGHVDEVNEKDREFTAFVFPEGHERFERRQET